MLGDTQQLVQSNVLVIGDSCQDHYIFGECTRLSPEAPVPILLTKRREIRPGMARNVASNLENLGNSVSVVTQKQEILKTRYVSEPSLTHLLRVDDESEITSLSFYEIQKLIFHLILLLKTLLVLLRINHFYLICFVFFLKLNFPPPLI